MAKKIRPECYVVAEVMWRSDDRPCLWSDLDDEEKREWAVMAEAALNWIRMNAANMVSEFMFPPGSKPKPRDVIGVAKVIALDAIQRAANEPSN